jgi:hypothetical protein
VEYEPGYSALYAQVRKWFTEFYARYPENPTVAELGPKLVAFYPPGRRRRGEAPIEPLSLRLPSRQCAVCLKAMVLDWQLIRPGCAMFDVGLFLITSCRPELRRDSKPTSCKST